MLCAAICLALLHAPALAVEPPAAPTGLSCRAYLLYDVQSGCTVAKCNAGVRQPVASLTKLMTAILACERLRFDGRYILTPAEAKTFKTDTLRADKLLELMLVPSNNAACRLAARLAAGNEPGFVAKMNAKAAQLGLADTHYVNATGLPAAGQYSTAQDLLRVALIALTYPSISRALCLPATELAGQRYEGTLKELYQRHSGLAGGKTGYTKAAGRCLVLFYRSNGRDYVLITLGSKDVPAGFRDAENLLSHYGLYSGEVGQWK